MTDTFSYVDLNFLGCQKAIATAVVASSSGVALVDPGPSSCLESLERGLRSLGVTFEDVTDILLTHIHLDHAGATGTLVRRYPRVRVFVHTRGVKHLADPVRLIDSASRFFGAAQMERYWGEILPVPTDRMVVVHGDERIRAGGRTFEVVYTPGHAWHHVTYFDASVGEAFVGDTAGLRIDGGFVLPPTPPPDVAVEQWVSSIERIAALRPERMFLTHFGPVRDIESHLEMLTDNLRRLADVVPPSLTTDASDEERSQEFGRLLRADIRQHGGASLLGAYEPTASLESLWFGLARYWRTRGEVQ